MALARCGNSSRRPSAGRQALVVDATFLIFQFLDDPFQAPLQDVARNTYYFISLESPFPLPVPDVRALQKSDDIEDNIKVLGFNLAPALSAFGLISFGVVCLTLTKHTCAARISVLLHHE